MSASSSVIRSTSSSNPFLLRRLLFAPSLVPQCFHRRSTASVASSSDDKSVKLSTRLAKQISKTIQRTGPIPLATYMEKCRDELDTKPVASEGLGELLPTPASSRVLGEMLGLWVLTAWMRPPRKRDRVQVIMLGPGSGTLVEDVVRTLRRFQSFCTSLESIYLVEPSPNLRAQQQSLLCPPDATPTTVGRNSNGVRCMSKFSIPITWYPTLADVPASSERASYILSGVDHFSRLPAHVYMKLETGWRELLVSNHDDVSSRRLAPVDLPSSCSSSPPSSPSNPDSHHGAAFQLTLSRNSTPSSRLAPLPPSLPRPPPTGSTLTLSRVTNAIAANITQRLAKSRAGAALILDRVSQLNTLDGFRGRRWVDPFSRPGETQVVVGVDFEDIADRALMAVGKKGGIEVHGPVGLDEFLDALGTEDRLEIMEEGEEGRRLVEAGKEVMQKAKGYGVMAIVPQGHARKLTPLVGFPEEGKWWANEKKKSK